MNIFRHPVTRILVIVICVLISFGFIRSLWETWRGGDQVGGRRSVLQEVQKKHDQLSQQLQEATSAAFIDREARNKLGFVKEGETIILLGTPTPDVDQTQNAPQTPLSRWQQWWRLFF